MRYKDTMTNDNTQSNVTRHPVMAVGIGPGDPELISVKGLKALQQAELVFYPAGSASDETSNSISLGIIQQYQLTGKLIPMVIPMNGINRAENYRKAFDQIKQAWQQGYRVSVVSEGDILFYSTFGYLLHHLTEHQIPVDLIPGIPAFVLAASAMHDSLVDGDDSLRIVARPKSFGQITALLEQTETLVIMKMSILKDWSQFLLNCGKPFFYAEKLGTSQQYVTSSAQELNNRTIPYFSIIIIKNKAL